MIAGDLIQDDFYVRDISTRVAIDADTYNAVALRTGVVQTLTVTVKQSATTKAYTASFVLPAWAVGDTIAIRFDAFLSGVQFSDTKTIGTVTSKPGLITTTANYAVAKDLSNHVSYNDLAEVSAPSDTEVTGSLLETSLTAGDMSAVSADVKTKVDNAVARLNRVMSDASAEIDGYIVARYPTFNKRPHILAVRCVDIALYRLFGGADDSGYYRSYVSAIHYLEKVAMGKIDLQNSTETTNQNAIQLNTPVSIFTSTTLAGF